MSAFARSAWSGKADTGEAIAELEACLAGFEATLVVFFASARHDGGRVARALGAVTGGRVLGCSTSGEYTERGGGKGGIAALALGRALVPRVAVVAAPFGGVAEATAEGARALARELGVDLRAIDPARWVGLVLTDPLSGPELVNEVLGHAAPFLSFVGGSSGDEYTMTELRVYANDEVMPRGAGLALLEVARPFQVLTATGFAPTSRTFRVTRAKGRTVYELDGRPAAEVFAEAIGVAEADVGMPHFMRHPFGVVIDGAPWVRSVVVRTASRGLVLGSATPEGAELTLLASGGLLEGTARAIASARAALGGRVGAGVLFDCAYRQMELSASGLDEAYGAVVRGFPLAAGHTFGESYLTHHNHTLVGLLFAADAPA